MQEPPTERTGVALEPLRHTCEGCGRSCEGQLVGPLSDETVARLREHYAELSREHPRVAAHAPFMLGRTPHGTTLTFLHFPQKRCIFLGDDRACLVHRHFGAEAKPAACRRFPAFSIDVEDTARVALRPLCYRTHRSFDAGERFDMELLAEARKPRPALRAPNLPPEALEEARVQERAILGWLGEDGMTLPELLARVAGASPMSPSRDALPAAFEAHLGERLAALREGMAEMVVSLLETEHGRAIDAMLTALRDAPPRPLPAIWQDYALHALHQLVFLRETARFPSVAVGTITLAVGALAAARCAGEAAASKADSVSDTFAEPLTAWFRVFLQSGAFQALFPTPESLQALVGSLVEEPT